MESESLEIPQNLWYGKKAKLLSYQDESNIRSCLSIKYEKFKFFWKNLEM